MLLVVKSSVRGRQKIIDIKEHNLYNECITKSFAIRRRIMERVRSFTAFFFLGAGLLHLAAVVFSPFDPTQSITLGFGVAYLVFGYLLLRERMSVWVAGIVTLIGTLLNLAGMATKFNLMAVIFLVFDLALLAGCGYLLVKGKPTPKTV
jgi:hypothetical protein